MNFSANKEIIKKICSRNRNLIIYCMIGVSGVILDFIVFYLLSIKLKIFYQYANIISVSVGITNNFILNAFLNFKVKDNLIKRFFSFYVVGVIGILISSLLLYIFIDLAKYSILSTKIFTIFIVTIIQYNLNRLVSFRQIKKSELA